MNAIIIDDEVSCIKSLLAKMELFVPSLNVVKIVTAHGLNGLDTDSFRFRLIAVSINQSTNNVSL